jgi:diketogulonate reductase-like aldo/keto reductase
MKAENGFYKLANGVEIPCIGLGTWQIPDGDACVRAVRDALDVGYRHIDTAAAYGNEAGVGRAIRESGIPREQVFITSKLKNTDRGFQETVDALELSLRKLDVEYLDLYLIHWPNPIFFRDRWQTVVAETWRAFEDLYERSKVRAIGVSNFLPHHLREIRRSAMVSPMVDQIRLCPGDTQDETVKYCADRNILCEAYSPLGTGKVFDVPEMREIAFRYAKSVAQVCIRWSLQMGFLPLPKSVTRARIQENFQVFDFELVPEDMALIATLTGACGESRDPDTTSF